MSNQREAISAPEDLSMAFDLNLIKYVVIALMEKE